MNQSNAIAAFVAFVLVPQQLAAAQTKAALSLYTKTSRSVLHKCKDNNKDI